MQNRAPLLNSLGVTLALAATLVVGSDEQRLDPPAQPAARIEGDLDVAKLQRARSKEQVIDVFVQKAPPAPEPAPLPVVKAEPAPPPPPPAPPALPFRLVGKFVEGGAVRLLLSKGEAEHSIAGGETIDGVYLVESIDEAEIVFTYLPLKLRQSLSLEAPNEANR
jgi:hypothetical protein